MRVKHCRICITKTRMILVDDANKKVDVTIVDQVGNYAGRVKEEHFVKKI